LGCGLNVFSWQKLPAGMSRAHDGFVPFLAVQRGGIDAGSVPRVFALTIMTLGPATCSRSAASAVLSVWRSKGRRQARYLPAALKYLLRSGARPARTRQLAASGGDMTLLRADHLFHFG